LLRQNVAVREGSWKLLVNADSTGAALGPGGNSLALRKGDLVLIRQNKKPDELYDLAADPDQKTDLAAKRPETVAELSELLKKVSERDNDAKVLSK